jgi:hypothetical protein
MALNRARYFLLSVPFAHLGFVIWISAPTSASKEILFPRLCEEVKEAQPRLRIVYAAG